MSRGAGRRPSPRSTPSGLLPVLKKLTMHGAPYIVTRMDAEERPIIIARLRPVRQRGGGACPSGERDGGAMIRLPPVTA